MYKKVVFFLLVFMLALSIVGSAEEIRMGLIAPLTGPQSQTGSNAKRGAELAVEQINAKGGINGQKIKLIAYDDKASPEEAVKAATRLIYVDGVQCIIGSHLSGNVLASAPIAEKAQIPMIGLGLSPVWLQQGYKYIFRSVSNSDWGNKNLVEIMKEMGVARVGILHTSDEYAKVGSKEVITLCKAIGIEVLAEELFDWGDTDFTGQITKIINKGIDGGDGDGFVVYTNPEYTGMIMKQARQLGYDSYIYGPEGFGYPEVRDVAGEAANKAIFVTVNQIPDVPEDAINEIEKQFLYDYIEKYGNMPEAEVAYRGYDAAAIFGEAFKNAKSLKGPDIRDAIENITNFEGIAGTFSFKGNHGEGISTGRAFVIWNGKNVPYEKWKKNN